jgi:hypothetical protein
MVWRITVFACYTQIVGSNSTQGMDICIVCVYSVCVLRIGRDLATGLSPVQGDLPTVYRIRKLKKAAKAQQKALEL